MRLRTGSALRSNFGLSGISVALRITGGLSPRLAAISRLSAMSCSWPVPLARASITRAYVNKKRKVRNIYTRIIYIYKHTHTHIYTEGMPCPLVAGCSCPVPLARASSTRAYVKTSTGHTNTHAQPENNTPDTDTHTRAPM